MTCLAGPPLGLPPSEQNHRYITTFPAYPIFEGNGLLEITSYNVRRQLERRNRRIERERRGPVNYPIWLSRLYC